ncbi:Rft-1-domain-containing protein [Epithele typhae]|uniref:Rft-1-domain-containing protein n=1 Tax=Epithele typhae TaxID=378194 RepID=UPI0020076EA9|nr:Rft-1-domain-containing protein [Epithele typhae]KAH9915249.1 Rft-1-domain-containing protein [Epithele typhae]
MSEKPSLLSATLASGSSLVLLQIFSRGLVRLVSPQVFGTTSIQFELLLSTILFLSREGVRNALLRASSDPEKDADRSSASPLVANIALLPILLGIPTAVGSAFIYLGTSSSSTSSQPHFRASVALYVFAALSELLSEPMYIRTQNELRFHVRVRAEGAAVMLKTITTFVVLVVAPKDWSLVAFALGQTAYGLTTLVSFVVACRENLDFRPRKVAVARETMYFDPGLFSLSMAMTGQSLIKHFLTEGDKFLVSRLSPLADQGGYAVAANYGSLVARIVFQPIEETARVIQGAADAPTVQDKQAAETAATVLLTLLLAFTHLLLLLAAFGPPYLPLAVGLALPRRYLSTSAPQILSVYVYYIPAMAYNGVLEALLASAASPADLAAHARALTLGAPLFPLAAAALARYTELGDAGLVWANVANLALRAAYAARFARRFFAARGVALSWSRAVPPPPVLVAFAAAATVVRAYPHEAVAGSGVAAVWAARDHVGVGAACVLACLLTCVVRERTQVVQLVGSLRRTR